MVFEGYAASEGAKTKWDRNVRVGVTLTYLMTAPVAESPQKRMLFNQ